MAGRQYKKMGPLRLWWKEYFCINYSQSRDKSMMDLKYIVLDVCVVIWRRKLRKTNWFTTSFSQKIVNANVENYSKSYGVGGQGGCQLFWLYFMFQTISSQKKFFFQKPSTDTFLCLCYDDFWRFTREKEVVNGFPTLATFMREGNWRRTLLNLFRFWTSV